MVDVDASFSSSASGNFPLSIGTGGVALGLISASFLSELSAAVSFSINTPKEVATSFRSEMASSVDLTVPARRKVSSSMRSEMAGAVDLAVTGPHFVSASIWSELTGEVDMNLVSPRWVTASLRSSLDSTSDLSITSPRYAHASFSSSLAGTVSLTGASDTRGRTVCDLVGESLSLWGFVCSKTAPRYAIERALTDLNTALQLVWTNAEGSDYWTNETLTIPMAEGEDEYTLPDTVQNVTGPCRKADDNRPLAPLRSTGELESFSALYLNGDGGTEPLAYHVDRLKQSATDPAKCVFRITPAANQSMSFLLDVVKECPRYTMADLTTCPLVPIPHQYTETLLIPIIRYNASSYYLFSSADQTQKETINQEYAQARAALGLADPSPTKGGSQ